ncbi:hypothetical protein NE237_032093 [Protea cynaroides]|uniref:Uncharacterized protein n=1 Tax=Protea cynaroides TaxID=273540 RepID=A0A9Q0L3C5_9MAGN|nr:hypothetical protein NE237_032093 [Protea cynaroides]
MIVIGILLLHGGFRRKATVTKIPRTRRNSSPSSSSSSAQIAGIHSNLFYSLRGLGRTEVQLQICNWVEDEGRKEFYLAVERRITSPLLVILFITSKMSSLTAIVPLTVTSKASLGKTDMCGVKIQFPQSSLVRPVTRSLCFQSRKPIRMRSVICAAALNAKCGAEQTQTVTRQSPTSVITNAPIQGKEKSPELDDGGTGFPPRDDGDGGGGGGGGGGGWKGGFFFFGFLVLLGLLKDQESESPYRDTRER